MLNLNFKGTPPLLSGGEVGVGGATSTWLLAQPMYAEMMIFSLVPTSTFFKVCKIDAEIHPFDACTEFFWTTGASPRSSLPHLGS